MKSLRDLVQEVEKAALPHGRGDRFAGYAVLGVPFRSGHVLALRRFSASSVGPGYTSVWHRDPDGRWTFFQDVQPEQSCPRYFGQAISENSVGPIRVAWHGPYDVRVSVDCSKEIVWELTLASTAVTRSLNAAASLLPEAWWSKRTVLSIMGKTARVFLGAGKLNLAGRTPNGQTFMANPRLIWAVASSRAAIGGQDLGVPGPLPQQSRLGDFWIPQRGIFAIASAVLQGAEKQDIREAGVASRGDRRAYSGPA